MQEGRNGNVLCNDMQRYAVVVQPCKPSSSVCFAAAQSGLSILPEWRYAIALRLSRVPHDCGVQSKVVSTPA